MSGKIKYYVKINPERQESNRTSDYYYYDL